MVYAAITAGIILSYLIGSVNTAITVCKIVKRKDIRDYGSKSAGLTNVYRTFGAPTAAVTLILDLAKGVVAVFLTKFLAKAFGADELDIDLNTILYLASFAVTLGHIFPVFYKFKGGKGALVAATSLLAMDPLVFCIEIPVFIIVILFTKYVSVGSITAAALYPLLTGALQYIRGGYENVWLHTILAAAIALTVIFRHSANIKRLMSGTENKFSFKKK